MPKLIQNIDSAKFFLSSKTFQGILIAVAPIVAGIFGFNMDSDFANQLPSFMSDFTGSIDKIVELVGLLYAGYGRMSAEVPVWFIKKS